MSNDVERALVDGIENGEWFEVIYHGGSNPGARRRIAPISVSDNKVRARCYTSNAVKLFALSKIEILESDDAVESAPEWRVDAVPKNFPGMNDARDVYAVYKDILAANGWRVELVEYDVGWHLMLYGFLKNGKPRKTASMRLEYEHTTYDHSYIYDPDPIPVRINPRPRVRPWSYRGTYAQSYKPIYAFLVDAGLSDADIKSLYPSGAINEL